MKRWFGQCIALFAICANSLFFHGTAFAQPAGADLTLNAWLSRVHQAARQSVYTGTFVVSSGNNMASARIWHVCDGTQQLERVESLSGTPRAIFRRNDQVVTFFPQSRLVFFLLRPVLPRCLARISRHVRCGQTKPAEKLQHFFVTRTTLCRASADFLHGADVDNRWTDLFHQIREVWQGASLRHDGL